MYTAGDKDTKSRHKVHRPQNNLFAMPDYYMPRQQHALPATTQVPTARSKHLYVKTTDVFLKT